MAGTLSEPLLDRLSATCIGTALAQPMVESVVCRGTSVLIDRGKIITRANFRSVYAQGRVM